MNKGIVVGKIYNKDGRPAPNAKVKVHHVTGSSGKLEIQRIEGKTNRNGEFQAPFLWKGVEWGNDELGTTNILIRIVAWTEEGDLVRDGYSRDTSFTARTIRGYRSADILRPVHVATGNPFNLDKDLADFVISIGQALVNYKNLVPFWKISEVTSAEGEVIAGGIDLWLDNTN